MWYHRPMSDEFREAHLEAFIEWLMQGDTTIPFDLHAQDIDDYTFMKRYIPTLIVSSAGGLCPFQAEGYMFDLAFYYRERHGWAELRLAHTHNECYGGGEALYAASTEVPEFRDSRTGEWLQTLLHLVPQLERSPFLYQFPCKKVVQEQEGGVWRPDHDDPYTSIISSWGDTLEEAWNEMHTFHESWGMSSAGMSRAEQESLHEARLATVLPEPVETDNRIFPDPEPVFEILH